MNIVQLFFRARNAKADDVRDKVQMYQHNVLWWQNTYQAMDWLFLGSGPGERFAHGQLSRLDSELSTNGRELARS